MIRIENTETFGWKAAVRGMRNPLESWGKSDSVFEKLYSFPEDSLVSVPCAELGKNDLDLMKRLVGAGSDDRKFMRMIHVQCDITAPLYWWKEYDTYKVGTVANSCSTMHKIHSRDLTLDDFSHDRFHEGNMLIMRDTINVINRERNFYMNGARGVPGDDWEIPPKDKGFWWQMIQLLPSSYNQRRTVDLNYEVLLNMYCARKNHKLDEWREFCGWIESLPYAGDLLVGEMK